jgi:hypothetical protein
MKKLIFIFIALAFVGCSKEDEQLEYMASYQQEFRNIDQLNVLKDVEIFNGDLRIIAPSLESLEILKNLSVINGNLELHFNSGLKTLSGLENLKAVKSIIINENENLINLEALRQIKKVEMLRIIANDKLRSLDGLENLRDVKTLLIYDNKNLNSIDALGQIKEVERLEIYKSDMLPSLSGLQDITVLKALIIEGNPLLEEIGKNITFKDSIAGGIYITENESLKNISFLNGVKKIEYLWLKDNPLLTFNQSLDQLESVEYFKIENNSSITSLEIPGLQFFYELDIEHNQNLSKVTFNNQWRFPNEKVYIKINSNEKLQYIEGFNNLDQVELFVRWNNSLENFNGLNSVNSVKLYVEENPMLKSFDVFQNAQFNDYNISFYNNQALSNYCGLNKLLESDLSNGSITLENNLYNPTQAELLNGICSN